MPRWDYLIVTASNEAQARAYAHQLGVRRRLGMLNDYRVEMVVADPEGKRVGSGGSTLCCLFEVLGRELAAAGADATDWSTVAAVLGRLRVLILHAGGDSRRLPAYGPCGKIFVPLPGPRMAAGAMTVFDHLLATLSPLSASEPGRGQIVIAAGDALTQFDPATVRFASEGLTALGCYATPEQASKHGVFCAEAGGDRGSVPVRRFLQKPSLAEQAAAGAIDGQGRSILDVAVMSFDAATAVALLQGLDATAIAPHTLGWPPLVREQVLTKGLDLYREICCALGSEATALHHAASAIGSGSKWSEEELARIHVRLNAIPFRVEVLPCTFLHFGTTRQLITSGQQLVEQREGVQPADGLLSVNTRLLPGGLLLGKNAWIEGCALAATVELAGENVVVGVDIDRPLQLPAGACLEVLAGRNRQGQPVAFVRVYHVRDTFKETLAEGATFCGRPMTAWLAAWGIEPEAIWPAEIPPEKRTLWDARVFPAAASAGDYHRWLGLFAAEPLGASQRQAFLAADRYSAAEIATLADLDAFSARRAAALSDQ